VQWQLAVQFFFLFVCIQIIFAAALFWHIPLLNYSCLIGSLGFSDFIIWLFRSPYKGLYCMLLKGQVNMQYPGMAEAILVLIVLLVPAFTIQTITCAYYILSRPDFTVFLPNLLLATLLLLYYVFYRENINEYIISGLFAKDKVVPIVLFAFLFWFKNADNFTHWTALNIFMFSCIFIFNTDRDPRKSKIHLLFLGLFAITLIFNQSNYQHNWHDRMFACLVIYQVIVFQISNFLVKTHILHHINTIQDESVVISRELCALETISVKC
jgi:hypothetical protein